MQGGEEIKANLPKPFKHLRIVRHLGLQLPCSMLQPTTPTDSATAATDHQPALRRRLGLVQATALNMIDMVGIGPFVTLPLVMGLMGPYFLLAWLVGAGLAVVDGLIWSELGAAYPEAGGSYRFLKLAYGEHKWGRLMSFL